MNVATKLPDVGEIIDDDVSEAFTNSNYDSFSATSTSCTSCSYVSYNMKINDTQLRIQPIHGHTSDCHESVAGNIGSISVQNATDATFGNRTFINTPVVIKQLVVDFEDRNANATETNKKPSKPVRGRILKYLLTHPFMVCSVFGALAIIVAALVLAVHFLVPSAEIFTCNEVPSVPTYYECGFASACTRCKADYTGSDICTAYYNQGCNRPACFCWPGCLVADCRVA